jgi:hypothetical protein
VRPEAALADRNASVQRAARGWKKAGAIDDAALAAIVAAVPDDRVRVGPVFRVLLCVFALVTINAGVGFVWAIVGSATSVNEGDIFTFLAFVAGAALIVLTELQTGRFRRAQGGTEAATSFMAVGYPLAGSVWIAFEMLSLRSKTEIPLLLLLGAALFAAAAWRWGFPLYAALSAAALLGVLTYLPLARLLWIALPLAATPILLRLADSVRQPPAHRASAMAALIVGLAGVYFAVHLSSVDLGLIEALPDLRRFLDFHPAQSVRWMSIAATALFPVVLLAYALRSHRRQLLLLGIATAIASLVTLRQYVHVAPLWVVLTGSGAATAVLALGVRRWLDSGPARERFGFTAEPLFDDLAGQRALEIGAALVTLSPGARQPDAEPGFQGGGGELGGGGSSSSF